MLLDAFDAFLSGLANERELDEPFIALLHGLGYHSIALTHGANEFGKDVIAQKDGVQFAFQLKLGDVGAPAWREMRGQLDELRLSDYSGPEFDVALPRRTVLVLTGRFKGTAGLLVTEYNRHAEQRGEPKLESWNRDHLASLFVAGPSAVLRGSVDGALFRILGDADRGSLDMDYVQGFSFRWDTIDNSELCGLGGVEAMFVGDRLRSRERVDLAAHLALGFVRAALVPAGVASPGLDLGLALFERYAESLWLECDERLLRKRGLIGYSGVSAWVTYPIRCSRIAEILGLYGLLLRERDPATSAQIADWLARFTATHPAAAHLASDRYAVGLVPPVLLLAERHRAHAKKLLRRATVWICDRYERGSFGLARSDAPPIEEVERLLGAPLEHVRLRSRRGQSYAATVVLDLLILMDEKRLYADARNDFLAVDVVPQVLLCPDDEAQLVYSADENLWELNPPFPDDLRRDQVLPPHLVEEERALVRSGHSWALLAVSAVLRDRHFPSALRTYLSGCTQG